MRKLFHATTALSALLATSMAANAADAYARPYSPPPYVPPVYAPPPFSWTGFYVGGNIGGAWSHRDVTDTFFLGQRKQQRRIHRGRPSRVQLAGGLRCSRN